MTTLSFFTRSGYEHLQHAGQAQTGHGRGDGGGEARREDRGAGRSGVAVALTNTANELGAADVRGVSGIFFPLEIPFDLLTCIRSEGCLISKLPV